MSDMLTKAYIKPSSVKKGRVGGAGAREDSGGAGGGEHGGAGQGGGGGGGVRHQVVVVHRLLGVWQLHSWMGQLRRSWVL